MYTKIRYCILSFIRWGFNFAMFAVGVNSARFNFIFFDDKDTSYFNLYNYVSLTRMGGDRGTRRKPRGRASDELTFPHVTPGIELRSQR